MDKIINKTQEDAHSWGRRDPVSLESARGWDGLREDRIGIFSAQQIKLQQEKALAAISGFGLDYLDSDLSISPDSNLNDLKSSIQFTAPLAPSQDRSGTVYFDQLGRIYFLPAFQVGYRKKEESLL